MEARPEQSAKNPKALSIEDAAVLFSRLGGRAITVEMIEADCLAGAPRNLDGTLNLLDYAAWLVREMGSGD